MISSTPDPARNRPATRLPPADVDVLIPTADRPAALAPTLAGLLGQVPRAAGDPAFRVVVADQSRPLPTASTQPEVATAVAALRRAGVHVRLEHRPHRRGIAEQRQWLLDQADAAGVLFLDDDVLLGPGALARMWDAFRTLRCGLVGMPVLGMSYAEDERPGDWSPFEPWHGDRVVPERVRKGEPSWERWRLHNAATPLHLERLVTVPERGWVPYRIAWVGGCTLYDTAVLRACGGYAFWRDLPADVRGEDVVAQLRVMEVAGGAGILPSTAYHLELPTTLRDRRTDAYAAVLEAQPARGAVEAVEESEQVSA